MASAAPGVVLHFGMHKTGTSSIQGSLYRRLADPAFHYVDLGNANAGGVLSDGFRKHPLATKSHRRRATPPGKLEQLMKRAVARFDAELQAAGARTAVVSGEALSNFAAADLGRLCERIAGHGRQASAVGYVRRPKEALESAFQQRVRDGLDRFAVDILYRGYRDKLAKFDAVLGADRVRMWRFDPRDFPGACVVQDFCARLGIALPPEGVVRVNESLSLPALSLLYAYRKFGPGYGEGPAAVRENRELVGRLRSLSGPRLRFHSALVAPVLAAHGEDIAWAQARLGQSLAEDLSQYDSAGLRGEHELLAFSPQALDWLARELGEAPRSSMEPPEVAERMHRLRLAGGTATADAPRVLQHTQPSG